MVWRSVRRVLKQLQEREQEQDQRDPSLQLRSPHSRIGGTTLDSRLMRLYRIITSTYAMDEGGDNAENCVLEYQQHLLLLLALELLTRDQRTAALPLSTSFAAWHQQRERGPGAAFVDA